MTVHKSPLHTLGITMSRLRRSVGWGGLGGLVLLASAGALAASGWNDRRAALESASRVRALAAREAPAHAPADRVDAALPLPTLAELPSLLNRVESVVVANRLAWTAADYRLRPATDREPAAMEIHTQFTGPYPQVRRTVIEIAAQASSVVVRQLEINRASTDAPDVTAKVVFAILLADDIVLPAASSASTPTGIGALQ